ncbi:MAG TPA: universal stress protein [Methylomirabilota bacterium]|nr:universal stress protein [Methylomirabilota bacterium]
MTFRRILVATDFAESAERALECAVDLAKIHGAELVLLHVYMDLPAYPEVSAGQVATIYEEQRRWVDDALDRRARSARASGVLARALVRTGAPAPVIAETAADERVDLVVVGTHGRSGLDRLLVGSVAERVVRTAPCPVLVAKTRTTAARVDAA